MGISIIIGTFGTVHKWLVRRLEDLEKRGQVKIVQIAALLGSVLEYGEESWRHEEICCHSNSSRKLSANIGVKNTYKSDLIRELKKKLWNMKVTVILIVIVALRTALKGLVKGLKDLKIGGRDHPKYSLNTEKGPRDLRSLNVAQTPVKSH